MDKAGQFSTGGLKLCKVILVGKLNFFLYFNFSFLYIFHIGPYLGNFVRSVDHHKSNTLQ